MDYLVGLSGCSFIVGLGIMPTPRERLYGSQRRWSLALFALSALLLIGTACT
jgi:hypothetical protein